MGPLDSERCRVFSESRRVATLREPRAGCESPGWLREPRAEGVVLVGSMELEPCEKKQGMASELKPIHPLMCFPGHSQGSSGSLADDQALSLRWGNVLKGRI